jgi:hypothetical protein
MSKLRKRSWLHHCRHFVYTTLLITHYSFCLSQHIPNRDHDEHLPRAVGEPDDVVMGWEASASEEFGGDEEVAEEEEGGADGQSCEDRLLKSQARSHAGRSRQQKCIRQGCHAQGRGLPTA